MPRRLLLLASAALGILSGCEKATTHPRRHDSGFTNDYSGWSVTDHDRDDDGYERGEDCDDDDPAVHPGATEICDDHVDNDCDGFFDTADVEDCPG